MPSAAAKKKSPTYDPKPASRPSAYRDAGVDTVLAHEAVSRIVRILGSPSGILGGSYFAAVIEFAGTGLALCNDGPGSKALIAQMMDSYDTIGIDCVAMNVNDLICVGARPVAMLDYIAVDVPDPDRLAAIARGLRAGADQAGISIPGGELSQIKDIIRSDGDFGFDLVGSAVGQVALDEIVIGEDIKDGDVVIGVESNGVHCNGLTLARKALLDSGAFSLHEVPPDLTASVGQALLAPTYIYVQEALEVLQKIASIKALIHITSDGFLNLNRVKSDASYVIDSLPPVPAIFKLIQELGSVGWDEMFSVYNMGIGFCFVVGLEDAARTIAIAKSHGRDAWVIGKAVSDGSQSVEIEEYGLIGKGKHFRRQTAGE